MSSYEYLKSTEVKVFPSAYRGTVGAKSTGTLYNPEARLSTENNYISLANRFTKTKKSFVISYSNNILICSIAGYWFRLDLSNHVFTDNYIFAKIKIDAKNTAASSDTQNITYPANSLTSFNTTTVNSSNVVDALLDATISGNDTFTGIQLIGNSTTSITTADDEFALLILYKNGSVYSVYPSSLFSISTNDIEDASNPGYSIVDKFKTKTATIDTLTATSSTLTSAKITTLDVTTIASGTPITLKTTIQNSSINKFRFIPNKSNAVVLNWNKDKADDSALAYVAGYSNAIDDGGLYATSDATVLARLSSTEFNVSVASKLTSLELTNTNDYDNATPALSIAGGIDAKKSIRATNIKLSGSMTSNTASIIADTDATSKTTGALTIAGGLGVVKTIYASDLNLSNSIKLAKTSSISWADSTSTSGSITASEYSGNSKSADTVDTTLSTSNTSYNLNLSINDTTKDGQPHVVYASSTLSYNPSTQKLTVGSSPTSGSISTANYYFNGYSTSYYLNKDVYTGSVKFGTSYSAVPVPTSGPAILEFTGSGFVWYKLSDLFQFTNGVLNIVY